MRRSSSVRSSTRRWVLGLFAALAILMGRPHAEEPEAAEPPVAAAVEEKAEPAIEYATPERVTVGVYLNDIQAIDLKTHSYAVDAYIWFRWRNPELDPATAMEFVNPFEQWGHMATMNYEEPETLESGELYQAVRIQGGFSKKLPLYNYPFDRQTLSIVFEDSKHEIGGVVYVPDGKGISINPKMVLPGYEMGAPTLTISEHTYPTNFGFTSEPNSTYSRAQVDLPINRPPVAYATKLLVPVLCVILCATLMFVLSPVYVDARVDVGITALLTIVALQMTFNQDVPDVGYLMLMDKIYLCAYLFVIAGLLVVVKSTRMAEAKNEAAALLLHRRGLSALLAAWSIAMVLLVGDALRVG